MPPVEYVRYRSGHPEFVRSNSFSHRHHHHHHVRRPRCHDDCCGVSWADYNNLLEQNRNLLQSNKTLKADLDRAVQANRAWSEDATRLREMNERLSGDVQRLSGDICVLRDELDRCRRSCSSDDDHQVDGFKRRIKALERELKEQKRNSSAEIRALNDDITKSNDVANQWKRKFDELRRMYDNYKDDARRQLERKNETIREQAHTIQRLRDLLDRYRGW